MKIGIIVYSKTGNTYQVAEKMQQALSARGHEVSLERFQAETQEGSNTPVRLTAQPSHAGYDAVVFGAPVQAFSLDPAMAMYLRDTAPIAPVKTALFITQHFPKPWMGGNNAARQLSALLKQKGANAKNLGIVNWTNKLKDSQIESVVQNCCAIVEGA